MVLVALQMNASGTFQEDLFHLSRFLITVSASVASSYPGRKQSHDPAEIRQGRKIPPDLLLITILSITWKHSEKSF